MVPGQQTLKVGLVSAGIGGLAAAIAIARAGVDVTARSYARNGRDWSWHPDDPKCGSPAVSLGRRSSYRQ